MLLTESFAVAKKNDIFIFISAPAINGAPFLAVISTSESLSDVSALSIEELALAIRDELDISTEEVARMLPELLSWQAVANKDWSLEEHSGYYVRVSPFVKPGLTPEENEFCFLLWHSLDNGSMHVPASSLYAIPDIDHVRLIETVALAAIHYEQLAEDIGHWLQSE